MPKSSKRRLTSRSRCGKLMGVGLSAAVFSACVPLPVDLNDNEALTADFLFSYGAGEYVPHPPNTGGIVLQAEGPTTILLRCEDSKGVHKVTLTFTVEGACQVGRQTYNTFSLSPPLPPGQQLTVTPDDNYERLSLLADLSRPTGCSTNAGNGTITPTTRIRAHGQCWSWNPQRAPASRNPVICPYAQGAVTGTCSSGG